MIGKKKNKQLLKILFLLQLVLFVFSYNLSNAQSVSCPNDTIVYSSILDCYYSISDKRFDTVSTSGFNSITNVENSFDGSNTLNGKQLPVSNHIISWTVMDIDDTASCNFNFFVEDSLIPTVICQDTTIWLAGDGTFSIDTTYINNGSSDACGIDTMWLSNTIIAVGMGEGSQ